MNTPSKVRYGLIATIVTSFATMAFQMPIAAAAVNQPGGTTNARDCPDCTCEKVTVGYWECKDKAGMRWICSADKKNCENVPKRQPLPHKKVKPPVAPLTPQKAP